MTKKTACFVSLFMVANLWPKFVLAEQVLFTTWNFEWLTNRPVEKISESKRTSNDLIKLAEHLNNIRPDILAFQEVDSISAINNIIDNKYKIYISDRNNIINKYLQFKDINQYTGFAISDKWQVSDPEDIRLSPNRKLRFASYVILQQKGYQPIHLLSVHLKSGCSGKYRRKDSCSVLRSQGRALNRWINTRISHNERFMILGDFNHNLAYPKDWLWKEITRGTKTGTKESQVRLATRESKADCLVRSRKTPKKTYRYRHLIDHIIISGDLSYSPPAQNLYKKEQVLNYRLSDHCPLSVEVSY